MTIPLRNEAANFKKFVRSANGEILFVERRENVGFYQSFHTRGVEEFVFTGDAVAGPLSDCAASLKDLAGFAAKDVVVFEVENYDHYHNKLGERKYVRRFEPLDLSAAELKESAEQFVRKGAVDDSHWVGRSMSPPVRVGALFDSEVDRLAAEGVEVGGMHGALVGLVKDTIRALHGGYHTEGAVARALDVVCEFIEALPLDELLTDRIDNTIPVALSDLGQVASEAGDSFGGTMSNEERRNCERATPEPKPEAEPAPEPAPAAEHAEREGRVLAAINAETRKLNARTGRLLAAESEELLRGAVTRVMPADGAATDEAEVVASALSDLPTPRSKAAHYARTEDRLDEIEKRLDAVLPTIGYRLNKHDEILMGENRKGRKRTRRIDRKNNASNEEVA